jgi:predicted polyphosphate/ATP-dependent NAD kinase
MQHQPRPVGIIANPASGKDIRRLVSSATTVDTGQKINIVRRLLLTMTAVGIDRIQVMPDRFGIGERALNGLEDRPEVWGAVSPIEMPVEGTAADTLRAAAHLRSVGAGCIISIGGDGTCRVVAKACGSVPILPLSTGTNNVVPSFTEGTVAGLAAAYASLDAPVPREEICYRHKKLRVYVNGREKDLALVEVVLVSADCVGARAVWEAESMRQIFVTRASPATIGLSSVIGMSKPIDRDAPIGAQAVLGMDGRKVLSLIAPGRVVPIGLKSISELQPGTPSAVSNERPGVLALDGEREIVLQESDEATIGLDLKGPWIVDVEKALRRAVADHAFSLSRVAARRPPS